MMISESTRFPHPVLGLDTGDFVVGEFGVDITVRENPSIGSVTFEHRVNLTEPGILALVEGNQASIGCIVKCQDTYFTEVRRMAWPTGETDFSPGLLLNKVSIRPIVWLRGALQGWDPGTIHHEFELPVSLKCGDVVAVGDELVISVGQAKLAPIESIFNLVRSKDVPGGTLKVDVSGDYIELLVSYEMFEILAQLRAKAEGAEILMNSIYMPAVMEVLDIIRAGGPGAEFSRWYQPFIAKCDSRGIDIGPNMSILEVAQILLEQPLTQLSTLVGEREND